ncbi:HlyIII-domain-containing protein [Fomitiporia mediterranea MF3/22]|uniref:HlyIII-domain-containing protein n=1 Tax=Fomitiporia mediterranea (strain MF3/22) TaxID=694068 RepID=UPI0004408F40|nr:HlyIII-domain-containing protein [Fomitiporia mediterranea MF3/22]EJD03196.1 HlyIII-domain-containing protein [Fomitiporia mediterranea MF3/22]
MSNTTVSEVVHVQTEAHVLHRRVEVTKHRQSTQQRPRSASTSCNPLSSSLTTSSLSMASHAPVLASVRVLVLSHLAELERRLVSITLSLEDSENETLDNSGEQLVTGETHSWAHDTLEMLRRIRSDVSSHLPDLPFDVPALEELLHTHFHDLSYQVLLDDIRAHLPDLPRPHMPDFTLSDVQTKLHDVRAHLYEMSLDMSQPMSYLPVLSQHLNSLQAHLAAVSARSDYVLPSLPPTSTLSELLDRVLSSDMVPAVLHRVDGHDSPFERVAREYSEALKKSYNGARLVSYVDLPKEWRNNPWVDSGYRFIPLHKWPIILLSLFALHNETLNIHTHMIPLLHTALHFIPSLNYASVPLDRPEKFYTGFAMLCLLLSVVWHTMSGCAHRVGMELCARVDYVGIGWLISASVGTVVYYGFSCHSEIVMAYLSLCLVTGILGSVFPFMAWFNDRKYKPVRVVFFLGMAFTALAPMAHLTYMYSFSSMVSFIRPIAPSFLSYIIGLVFYVTHVPERFVYSKGIAHWTDWLGGGSHAIWHAFIVLAIYQHRWGMVEMRAGVDGEGCVV